MTQNCPPASPVGNEAPVTGPRLELEKHTTQGSAPQEFHYFPKLPTELRIMIWQMAVRPRDSMRGIEYFSIFRTSPGRESSPLKDYTALRRLAVSPYHIAGSQSNHDGPVGNFEYVLAAPRVNRSSSVADASPTEYSWFKGNPSFYTWDVGMFTACRESREVIRKVVARTRTRGYREWALEVQHDGGPLILHNRGDGGVFCPEVEREDIQLSMSMHWGKLLKRLVLNPTAFAFEYDPSWLENLPAKGQPFDIHLEASPRGVMARCFDAWCRGEFEAEIWLIDRTLKVPGKHTFVKNRKGRVSMYPSGLMSPYIFGDTMHTYSKVEASAIFWPQHTQVKKTRESAFHLCQRLTHRKNSLGLRKGRSCLGVLAVVLTDDEDAVRNHWKRGWDRDRDSGSLKIT